MLKIINWIFPKKTNWVDISCYELMGTYYLIQMRKIVNNGKKEFRTAKIGFVNDYIEKPKIYENIFSFLQNDNNPC